MKKDEVLKCSFSAWYPIFKNNTIKSEVIPLPQEFVKYLLSDGVVLPEAALAECQLVPSEINSGTDHDDTEWDTEDPTSSASAPSFPEFENKLKDSIQKLGGKVFPKLNWSSPKDAVWMSFEKNLKCVCPGDVYLLLKSSDFIAHDLTQPFLQCDDFTEGEPLDINFELVLRKWCDMQSGLEFRCFVHDGTLVAISQRDCSQHFDFLPIMKNEIMAGIKSFFYHVVRLKFPCNDFVFDVYQKDGNAFWVLDFNPFGPVTDPLMFTWEEMEQLKCAAHLPVFRCIEEKSGVQPSAYCDLTVPRDMVDICTGEDSDKLVDLLTSTKIHGQDSSDLSSSESDLSDMSETEMDEAEKQRT